MVSKSLLQNRKRTGEMSDTVSRLNQTKKEQLLNLKLQALESLAAETGQLLSLKLQQIVPDPHQPRKTFKNLEALAHSIKEQGLLQPLVVRKIKADQHQIVVGERRFRAAKLAGLTHVPAILREQEDADTLILQLLENDQRDQVSPLEEALALQKLIVKMKCSKQEVAKELGRDAAWVSMRLGLLSAHPQVQALVREDKIHDLRTLHELRKLADEDLSLFEDVMQRLQTENLGSGVHRQLIREARTKKTANLIPEVLKAEYAKNHLTLHLKGKRKPMVFQLDLALLQQIEPGR